MWVVTHRLQVQISEQILDCVAGNRALLRRPDVANDRFGVSGPVYKLNVHLVRFENSTHSGLLAGVIAWLGLSNACDEQRAIAPGHIELLRVFEEGKKFDHGLFLSECVAQA